MRYLFIFSFLVCASSLIGQTYTIDEYVIASSGLPVTSTDGTIELSFTIGEPIDVVLSSDNFTLAQGYQQPGFSEITHLEDNTLDIVTNIFPNPSNDIVSVELGNAISELNFELFDLLGQSVLQWTTKYGELHTTMDMSLLPSGQYVLKISSAADQASQSFNIIKQ